MYWLCYGEYRGKRELKSFLRYVSARAEQQRRECTYRFYVCETLRLMPQNQILKKSYYEMLQIEKKEEIKDGKKVAEEVAKKMNTTIDWGR